MSGRLLAAPSTPKQGQVRSGSDRTIHSDAIRDNNLKAIWVEARNLHMGRCVAVKRFRPLNRQVKACSRLPASEASGSDPRARIGAGDPTGSGIPDEIGADRS